MGAWGWCKHSSPSMTRQQKAQGHTCSPNENVATCIPAKAEASVQGRICLALKEAGTQDCTQHWMQVYTAASTVIFSTNTSDFPRYTFKEVNCTNPILVLPTFSSPTFQLASQHCSKWRIEQRWCKWTWWIASSKETENINIFIISGIHTILTCTTTAPRFNKHTCRTPK